MKSSSKQLVKGALFFLVPLFLLLSVPALAQPKANHDESKVGAYTLPPLLVTGGGKTIGTAAEWETLRRPVMLQQFTEHVYGRIPGRPRNLRYQVATVDEKALNGKATRKEVVIYFTKEENAPSMTVLLYLPNNSKAKAPVVVGLNFDGNHTTQKDPGITITENWKKLNPGGTPIERGSQDKRWPVEEMIKAGYAVATAWYEDLEPDHPEGWRSGIRSSLQQELAIQPGEWGAVAAWAWGLSRIMDYLQTDSRVNAEQVVLTGHSRLGKAALWAGANDQRFAIVVSNNSGEGGAALARRNFGETVAIINTSFPHWFVDRYKAYNNAVDRLPVDQHMLLALVAPRPLYVASASDDAWADPKGEFLGAREAGRVYALYGLKGIEQEVQPPADTPVGHAVKYHLRTGPHDMLLYDWQQYLLFANQAFKR